MKRISTVVGAALLVTACAHTGARNLASGPAWKVGDALPVSSSPLFSRPGVARLSLEADFDRVHRANAGGNWTGEDRGGADFWSGGLVAELDDKFNAKQSLEVAVRARGMSSAGEGEHQFPKLRVEIADKENLKGTLFEGARNFRVNTHVDTNPKRKFTEMGRLVGENAPFREALGFEIAGALGLPTPAFRRAKIAYTDLGLRQGFTKNALVIETDKKFGERFGARAIGLDEYESKARRLDFALAVRFHLFQALIGNADYGLALKNEPLMGTEIYRPLFNTSLFELADGRVIPMVYDLDLSTLMRGLRKDDRRLELGTIAPTAVPALFSLSLLRGRLSRAEFEAGVAGLRSRLPAVERVIRAAEVDEEGRKNALAHIEAFGKALQHLATLPMMLKEGVGFYAEPSLKTSLLRLDPASEAESFLRPGMAVRVLEKAGNVAKIAILDARPMTGDLKDATRNVGYVDARKLVTGFDLPADLQGKIDGRDMAF